MIDFAQRQTQRQTQALSAVAERTVKLLAMPIAALRQEIKNEIITNPTIEESFDSSNVSLDKIISAADKNTQYDYDVPDTDNYGGYDSEALERRDHFFNSQVATETLQDHLIKQIPLAGFSAEEAKLAERLISDIADNGYFTGSVPDIIMVTGSTEEKIREILSRIGSFDPEGCGVTSLRECLLSQIDELKATAATITARKIIDTSLDALAANKTSQICDELKISNDELISALEIIKKLNPYPGHNFQASKSEYVEPDVHLRISSKGTPIITVDSRDIPDIKVSKRYLKQLQDPNLDPDARKFIQEKIRAAEELREAIANRENTIHNIAEEIVKVQFDFLTKKSEILNPLTQHEIAEKLEINNSTVSRTVNGKYMTSPRGTIELASLFATAIKTSDGSMVSNRSIQERIKTLISQEDTSKPLSDQKIADILKADGTPIARRTVAKYREAMNIPSASARSANN